VFWILLDFQLENQDLPDFRGWLHLVDSRAWLPSRWVLAESSLCPHTRSILQGCGFRSIWPFARGSLLPTTTRGSGAT
jgi:hypothetical protein